MTERGSSAAEQATVIRRVAQLANERRPDDTVLAAFLPAYYGELPEFDVDDRREDDLYAVALTHLAQGRVRSPGDTALAVLSPDRDRDGWHSDRSVVLLVTDDVPFLVDTVRIVLERHGVATHLLVHPMLRVDRDPAGVLTEIVERRRPVRRAGRGLDPGRDRPLRSGASRTVAGRSARRGHGGAPGRRRLRADARSDDRPTPHLDPLLEWLADGHFVFLGAATYELAPEGFVCRPGSALGQLAIGHRRRYRPADRSGRSDRCGGALCPLVDDPSVEPAHRGHCHGR